MSDFQSQSGTEEDHVPQEKSAYFEIVREQLQFWPYTIHQIDDTLDVGLIEARAKQLLFRAIHARNLTAFVGSGLSMSYGRLDWRGWEKEQNRTVALKARLFCELSNKALKWQQWLIRLLDSHEIKDGDSEATKQMKSTNLWRMFHPTPRLPDEQQILAQKHKNNVRQWLRGRERAIQASLDRIEKLNSTFELIKGKPGHFPGGEELPVKFEIAQQLHNELGDRTNLFVPSGEESQTFALAPLPDWGWAGACFSKRTDAPATGLAIFRKCIDER